MHVNESQQTSNLPSQEYLTSGSQDSIEQQTDDSETDDLALFALKHFGEEEDSTRIARKKTKGKDKLSCLIAGIYITLFCISNDINIKALYF